MSGRGRTGTPGIRPAIAPRLDDRKVDDVTRDHAAKINELASLPASSMKFIRGVVLLDGVDTPIAHGLGRPPTFVQPSAPRGALATGRIDEVDAVGADASKYVVLRASGWGSDITITLQVA